MLKIQNLACIPLTITPDDNIIPIQSDILKGKKINSIFIFSSTEDKNIADPYTDQNLAQVTELDDLNLFLNLNDINGNKIISDLSMHYICTDTEPYDDNFEIPVNAVLDFNKCFFNSKSIITSNIKILMYVLYQTDHFKNYTDEINGSVTITTPVINQFEEIKLSTLVNNTLNDKPIKRILVSGNIISDTYTGYLNIVSKNESRKIEYLPIAFSYYKEPKHFVFDPVEIDFEKSVIKNSDINNSNSYKLTFIY